MARRLTSIRHDVKHHHTLDRRRDYTTPSERDVQCPNYDGLFLLTGNAPIVKDMRALCHDESNAFSCDYKEKFGDFTLCKRYLKTQIKDFKVEKVLAGDTTGNWQELDIDVDLDREFANKYAEVSLALSRKINQSVDMGNFIKDWSTFNESSAGNWNQISRNGYLTIVNTLNQGGRSFWYNPKHATLTNYTYDYYVETTDSDNDMLGSVFRFNPDDDSFYSFEWDDNGLSVKGMAIYRNIRVGSNSFQKTLLAHRSTRWNRNQVYHVTVNCSSDLLEVTVRLGGPSGSIVGQLSARDNGPEALSSGAWGPMTQSQPNVFFWLLKYQEFIIFDKFKYPKLKKDIPLEYKSQSGSLFHVSNTVYSYFEEDVLRILADEGQLISSITEYRFLIESHNVDEGVVFNSNTGNELESLNKNAVVSMKSFPYDGNLDQSTKLVAVTRANPISYKYVATTECKLNVIVLKTLKERFYDTIEVYVNGLRVRIVPNVKPDTYLVDFRNQPILLNKGDHIEILYTPSHNDLVIYSGGFIDTHNKVFTIRGNELGWHHVPSRE